MSNPNQLIRPGDVVQIDANTNTAFPICFMIVESVHDWGVSGYIPIPRSNVRAMASTFLHKAEWRELHYIGSSIYLVQKDKHLKLVK